MPRGPTRWEREQKATLLALLTLVGLVSLVAYCTSPREQEIVVTSVDDAQSTTQSASPSTQEEEGSTK